MKEQIGTDLLNDQDIQGSSLFLKKKKKLRQASIYIFWL